MAVAGTQLCDVPCLERGHIGIAMASAADGVKQKADLLLHDNRFSSFPEAVRWSRVLTQNLHKFLQFHGAACTTVLVFTCVGNVAVQVHPSAPGPRPWGFFGGGKPPSWTPFCPPVHWFTGSNSQISRTRNHRPARDFAHTMAFGCPKQMARQPRAVRQISGINYV